MVSIINKGKCKKVVEFRIDIVYNKDKLQESLIK